MTAELRVINAAPVGNGVVELLEHYLDRARDGEFSSAFVVFVDREGVSGSSHSEIHCISTMIGAMERAKWDLIQDTHS